MNINMAKAVLVGFILVPVFDIPSEARGETRITEYPVTGAKLKFGWNSIKDENILSVCISADEDKTTYQDQNQSVDIISDTDTLSKAFNISASLKIKAITGGGGGQASFVHNQNLSQNATNVAVQAEVLNAPRFVVPIGARFKESATFSLLRGRSTARQFDVNASAISMQKVDLFPDMAELAKNDPVQFFKTCGDSFVSGIYEGARLTAILSFIETTSAEKQTIEASASGGGIGWDVSGSLAKTMDEYQKKSRLKIVLQKSGGSGDALPTDQSSLLNAVKTLPTSAANAPKPYVVILQTYDSLPSWPDTISRIDLTNQEKIARQYYQLRTLHQSIDDMIQNEQKYWWGFDISMDIVRKVQDNILFDIRNLEQQAKKCATEQTCQYSSKGLNETQDYFYRVSLPVPLDYLALKEPPTVSEGNTARWGYLGLEYGFARRDFWIVDPSIHRCRLFNECVENKEKDRYAVRINNAIYESFPQKVKDYFPGWKIEPE